MKSREESEIMSDVEMLVDIRDDSHHLGKICYESFIAEKNIATGRLVNVSYNTALRALRLAKRHTVAVTD